LSSLYITILVNYYKFVKQIIHVGKILCMTPLAVAILHPMGAELGEQLQKAILQPMVAEIGWQKREV